MKKDDQRIVVTGMGVVSCLGIGKQAFWEGLMEGRSGIRELTTIDTSSLQVHRGGEIADFRWSEHRPPGKRLRVGRTSQFAIAAAREALGDAGLADQGGRSNGGPGNESVGVIMGTTNGEQPLIEALHSRWLNGGLQARDRPWLRRTPYESISANVARAFQLRGYNCTVGNACASGNLALAMSVDHIRRGRGRIALAGAADSLSFHFFYGFARLRAIAPEKCQPFEKNRRGVIPAEGAAVLVLESLASARARGANVYAEVLGYGVSSDAFHVTAPDPDGRGMAQAIEGALQAAGLDSGDVSYVNAHGTGTARNDQSETRAIKKALGRHARSVPVSSIKSMIGHAAGAASALEAAACALAIRRGRIPPTINYEEPDPECDLDYVPNAARRADVDFAINNSSAFWGSNAVVAFGRPATR